MQQGYLYIVPNITLKISCADNCSLYDSKNTCRCENLINFSLKQGWISLNNPVRIESEIKNLKNVVSLYKTLQETLSGKRV